MSFGWLTCTWDEVKLTENPAIVGNAANQVFPTEAYWSDVYQVQNPYTTLAYNYYGTGFPFWDETAMFAVLDPSNVLNSTSCKRAARQPAEAVRGGIVS